MVTVGYARCCKALFVGWKIWFLRDHVHQRTLALASVVFKEKKKKKALYITLWPTSPGLYSVQHPLGMSKI